MKKINLFFAAMLIAIFAHSQTTVATFETLPLGVDTFWNGSDLSGGFTDGNAFFVNSYNTTYSAWSGFSYTDQNDTTTVGYTNQYSAITAVGYANSTSYAMADEFGNAKVRLIKSTKVNGLFVTNSTQAYLSMRDGDQIAKKFGGVTGSDPDWFKLTVNGWHNGVVVPSSVDFYLSDFRFADSTKDYIVKDWRWFDLNSLGIVDSLQFFLSSSDNGMYGMNTPAYFAIDNFTTTDSVPGIPVANNDQITILYIQDTVINVISNDYDPEQRPLTAHLIAGPSVPGAYAVDSSNGIFYAPALGLEANDFIIYESCNDLNLCDTAIVFITVNGINPAGIEEISSAQMALTPNPFTSSFMIQHPAGAERIQLYNMQGQQVRDITSNSSGKTDIPGEGLPPGVYFVRIVSGNSSLVSRIVKQ